ncbi:hypothetical protein CspeluHIS016_0104380 [Cutaneotrichosporon spelunceum]|uniref:Telomere replication protein EST3 n=1 Tax=Cutaneotrichosporon spelunceum TaxID=1672016 RepID=A0AAD3TNI3_9TREE|nr:hypothetical protein CspeluHIS016_0104380 [Cutaneotrichosporon spelunceum]
MAALLRPWIASSIISHDERYGADLSPRLTSPVLCQLVKFTSFRTASQPSRQVTAVVADRTHRVSVAFDLQATDSYEESKAGEDPERLTSSVRSILRLTEYSVSLVPRAPLETTQLPRVQLVVYRWTVVTGDGNDPVYFPGTVEIGRGGTKTDGSVNRVLRKWWLGDRHLSPNLRAHPVIVDRATLKSVNQLVADLATAGKPLPAWLFTPAPEAQREELDAIGVFGADPFKPESLASNGDASHGSNGHSVESQLTNGHTDESHMSNCTQYPPPESPHAQPPGPALPASYEWHEAQGPAATPQRPLAGLAAQTTSTQARPAVLPSPPSYTQAPALANNPRTTHARFQTPSDDSDEDAAIPIQPIRYVARRTQPPPRSARLQVFRSSPPRASSQPTGETDEDDLSDYERERRRKRQRPGSLGEGEPAEESVSKSQDSGSFNLARQSAPRALSSPIAPTSSSAPHVLVPTTTDESLQTDTVALESQDSPPAAHAHEDLPGSAHAHEDLPGSAHAHEDSRPDPARPRKRPRSSGAANDADDEASQRKPRPHDADAEPRPHAPVFEMTARSSETADVGTRSHSARLREPGPTSPTPLSVAQAVRAVLPSYRPDLTTFTVPGMSKELVEAVWSKAVEQKRGPRASGR